MRRLFIILLLILFLCGCVRSSGDYERGYADGYAAAMSEYSRAMPEVTPAPTPRATATPKSTTAPSGDFTVYVSRNGVIHKKSDCSGMLYYREMLYSETKGVYEKKCSKCFK